MGAALLLSCMLTLSISQVVAAGTAQPTTSAVTAAASDVAAVTAAPTQPADKHALWCQKCAKLPLGTPGCRACQQQLQTPPTAQPTVQTTEARTSPLIDATLKVRVTPLRWPSATGGVVGHIPIGYRAAPGRTGSYYLPAGYGRRQFPVMVALHGSGQDGYRMLTAFRALADKHNTILNLLEWMKHPYNLSSTITITAPRSTAENGSAFILIAPDSQEPRQWWTPSRSMPFTTDWEHIEACVKYVRDISGVKFNPRRIAYAGFSRGGYSAAAMASRVGRATHVIVLHSLMSARQMGQRTPKVWASTGVKDYLFPVSRMVRTINAFRKLKPGFKDKFHFQAFAGGHGLYNANELEASIIWWFHA